MPSEVELQQVVEWNDTAREYPSHLCIHELFERQVHRTPNAMALQFGAIELTYRELDERANKLAHHLITLGVGPEVIVGVCLERSLEQIISILAILKAGGAYLPLDAAYPTERLELMMDECRTNIVITQGELPSRLPKGTQRIVFLDDPTLGIARNPTTSPSTRVNSENLAYVIYTSGSTGKPKGVAECHRAAINFFHWCSTRFPMRAGDVFLQIAPFTFDASVFEIFTTLCSGAKLLLIRPGGQREPDYLVKMILRHEVTVASFVPPTLRMVIEEESFPSVRTLRLAFCGGEVMPLDLMLRFQYRSSAQLVNLYGPTEATVYCAGWVCDRHWRDLAPPIGKPIFNTQIHILDEKRKPVPVNCIGEIYLAGHGLARGYINRPSITAERFVANPFAEDPSSRMYRSGDLGFWNPDGTVSFVGRVDDQIKLRGFRIEPAEIETVLLGIPEISQALLICREDTPGDQQLVAYCIAKQGKNLPPATALRSRLAKSLPDYMIPSVFVEMERFPLNSNGKRDRKALPTPYEIAKDDEHGKFQRFPKDLLEQRLLELWQKVLGRKNFGIHDNFFDLGGHSLTAAILTNEIEKLAYQRLPIAVFFQAPTVAELSAYLKKNKDDPAWSSLVPLQPDGKKTPLFVMHGMGGNVFAYLDFARQLAPDRPVYGLQAIGLDGTHDNHDSIEAMAAYYADQIRALHPSGPYYLLGYSLGGWIAYAVADQLLKKGGRISLFVVLDTEAEAKVALGIRLHMHKSLHLEQARKGGAGLLPVVVYGLKLVGRRLQKCLGGQPEPSLPLIETPLSGDYFEAVCHRYEPPRLPLFVHLVVQSERKPWQIEFWHHYALGGVMITRMFEKHPDFIDPGKASELADFLRPLLEETDGR